MYTRKAMVVIDDPPSPCNMRKFSRYSLRTNSKLSFAYVNSPYVSERRRLDQHTVFQRPILQRLFEINNDKNNFIESTSSVKQYSTVGVFPPTDFREYSIVCRIFIAFVANDKKTSFRFWQLHVHCNAMMFASPTKTNLFKTQTRQTPWSELAQIRRPLLKKKYLFSLLSPSNGFLF